MKTKKFILLNQRTEEFTETTIETTWEEIKKLNDKLKERKSDLIYVPYIKWLVSMNKGIRNFLKRFTLQ